MEDDDFIQEAVRHEEEKEHHLQQQQQQQQLPGGQLIGPGGKYLKGRSIRDTLYGQICVGVHRETQGQVVIKEYNKRQVLQRKDRDGRPLAENPENELPLHAMLSKYRHPFVLELLDVCEDERSLYAIQEWCSGGDLFGYAQSGKFLPEVARHYFVQLAQGVDFLHRLQVAHCDLSLENLLLNGERVLKICDFGAAIRLPDGEVKRIQHKDLGSVGGRIQYLAPEVLTGQPYDPRGRDIWAMGVILFALIVGRFPYQQPLQSDRGFCSLVTNPRQYVHSAFAATGRFELQDHSPAARERVQLNTTAADLIAMLLSSSQVRLSTEGILRHPYCAALLQPQHHHHHHQQQQQQQQQ